MSKGSQADRDMASVQAAIEAAPTVEATGPRHRAGSTEGKFNRGAQSKKLREVLMGRCNTPTENGIVANGGFWADPE